MSRSCSAVGLLMFLFAVVPRASGQSTTQSQSMAAHPSESFKQLMKDIQSGQYYPNFPAFPQWLDNGKRYTLVEPSPAPAKGKEIVAMTR